MTQPGARSPTTTSMRVRTRTRRVRARVPDCTRGAGRSASAPRAVRAITTMNNVSIYCGHNALGVGLSSYYNLGPTD